MTPHEFNLVAEGYYEELKRKQDENITLAYMTAQWTAQWFSKQRPQSLDKILKIESKKEEMTADEMLKQVKSLNGSLGGAVN